jgi:hypothetical protein
MDMESKSRFRSLILINACNCVIFRVWVGVKNHFPMILKVFTGISLMKNYNFLMHVFFMHGLSSESVQIPWFDLFLLILMLSPNLYLPPPAT